MVLNFQEKVDDLLIIEEQIEADVRSLETCAYSTNVLASILNKVQKAVDDLSLHQYSNLSQWVTKLDEEVRCYFIAKNYFISMDGYNNDIPIFYVLFRWSEN